MILNNVILQEVLDRIEAKYGDLENECGCSVSTDNGWAWLSVANIVEIIQHVDEMFDDE
jgi:hypothetical protein